MPKGPILAIDLTALGWSVKSWDALLESYPYGWRFHRSSNCSWLRLDRVCELCGTPLAHIRADWFTVTATRPPLYHRLLELPESDVELEKRLGWTRRGSSATDCCEPGLQRAAFPYRTDWSNATALPMVIIGRAMISNVAMARGICFNSHLGEL